MYNFKLINYDTDSITISKEDEAEFSAEEKLRLLEELNNEFPEFIKFEPDGEFSKVIVLRTKNYILWDGKKLKIKGSALKSAKLELALKEFLNEIIWAIINDTKNYTEIYNKYIREALNIKDIKRWASKKSISEKVLSSERTNESKIRDAIEGTEYVEGDKCFVFFKEDKSLELIENFNGEYDKLKLCKRLFDTAQVFENIMDTKSLFLNYSLKRNQAVLKNV